MRHLLLSAALVFLAAASGQSAPVTNVAVRLDPPLDGKQVLTLSLTPTASFTADRIEAECQYRQAFDWPPKAPKPERRVTKPGLFTYTARQVKFVDALDLHLSFFVPVDVKDLREKHGSAFTTNAPVTVSTVTFRGFSETGLLWSFQADPVTNAGDGVLR